MSQKIHVSLETIAPVPATLDERRLVEPAAVIGADTMVSRFTEELGTDSKNDLSAKEASSRVQP